MLFEFSYRSRLDVLLRSINLLQLLRGIEAVVQGLFTTVQGILRQLIKQLVQFFRLRSMHYSPQGLGLLAFAKHNTTQ